MNIIKETKNFYKEISKEPPKNIIKKISKSKKTNFIIKKNTKLTKKEIKNIINYKEKNKDFEKYYQIIKPILEEEDFKNFIELKHHKNKKIKTHLIKVSYKAYQKSTKNTKINTKITTIGGLLHDFYNYNRFNKPNQLQNYNHGLIHSYIAFENVKKLKFFKKLTNNEQDILKDIITKHMWPFTYQPLKNKIKTKEGKLISKIDKLNTIKEYITFWKI